jgi:hypothetical protein
MSWDQNTGRQTVQQFLLDFLGLDPNQLLEEAINAKLAEKGLSYMVRLLANSPGYAEDFHPQKVIITDMRQERVFVEALTDIQCSDSWGSDYYSFVEAGRPFTRTRTAYDGSDDEPHVTSEVVPGSDPSVTSLTDLQGEANAVAPGMGDTIAEFFKGQGIDGVIFEEAIVPENVVLDHFYDAVDADIERGLIERFGPGEKLLPCPCCGGEAEHITLDEPEDSPNWNGEVISCGDCGVSSPVCFSVKDSAYPRLMALWNRREV